MADAPMRIMMIAPTPYFADRGCHVRIYEEARALIAQGCDVRIATYHIGRDMPGIPTLRIPHVPWYRRLTAGPSWQKPFLDILLFVKALSTARSFRPHVLHAHLHEGAFVAMLLKLLLRIPLVMDFQGSLTVECRDHGFFKQGSLLERLFAAVERLVNNAADAIITSSTAGAEMLITEWGLPHGKVTAVIDGVDTGLFRPFPRGDIRSRFQISDETPLVVYLGVLNEYQGLDLLLDAMGILKQQGSPVRFLVMGYPEEGYRCKAAQMGLSDMALFAGRIEYAQAAAYLSAGDIAVSPKLSRTEANGKLFNYMACGLPTVVFDTPVNREILGDCGVYAAYADTGDLARQIAALISDCGRRKTLSEMTRRKAVTEHSWAARSSSMMTIYKKISFHDKNR